MKRFLLLLCIFGPSLVIILSIWAVRLTRAANQAPGVTSHIVVAAGTPVRIRLIGDITSASKPGDMLQAIVASPVLSGMQTLIPSDTMAQVRLVSLQKRHDGKADVTLRLESLSSKNGTLSFLSKDTTVQFDRTSDLDVMQRAASGIIGGAIGAAVGGTVKGDPRYGAGSIGGFAAGASQEDTNEDAVSFQILNSTDVTGIKW